MLPAVYTVREVGHNGLTAYRLEVEPRSAPTKQQSRRATEPCLVSLGRTGTGGCRIDIATTSLSFAVIGAGRLGASLALALRTLGLSLLGYTARTPGGRKKAQGWLGGQALMRIEDAVALSPDVYFITVPDRALPAVAAELGASLASQADSRPAASRRDDRCAQGSHVPPLVAHTSGATTVSILLPCEEAGASTVVFHPLQTFGDPLIGQSRFTGAAVAITPLSPRPDGPAALVGHALAEALGARPFLLLDEKRSLYHAAATLACNYFVALEHHSRDLFVRAGLPSEEALALFLPLLRATVDNIEKEGTVQALTGPLSRGDTGTVSDHLTALEVDAPHLLPMYRTLALAALDLVRARGEVDPVVVDRLITLLQSPPGYDEDNGPQPISAEDRSA